MAEGSPCKIAVYPEDKFVELGYRAVTHPDGYIYFEKREPIDTNISNNSNNVYCDPTDVGDSSVVTPSSHDHNYSENSSVEANVVAFDDSKDDALETSSNSFQSGEPKQTSKLRGDPSDLLEKEWQSELESSGKCSCYFSTCNFISLSILTMVRHFRTCGGEPSYNSNLCTRCGCWLISSMQRDAHAEKCIGQKFGSARRHFFHLNQNAPCRSTRNQTTTKLQVKAMQVKTPMTMTSSAKEKKTVKPKNPIKLSFPCAVCGCLKETIHQAKSCTHNSNGSFNKDTPIVQPQPSTPPGEYLRRRPFASHHLIPWTLTLKEKKCIPCHREGCRFLAMSVEDMCTHYGSCIGDASFAPYHCSFCDGVVTSQNILDIHITLSHKDTRKESSPRVVTSLPKPHKFQPSILRRTSVIPKNSETKMIAIQDRRTTLLSNCNPPALLTEQPSKEINSVAVQRSVQSSSSTVPEFKNESMSSSGIKEGKLEEEVISVHEVSPMHIPVVERCFAQVTTTAEMHNAHTEIPQVQTATVAYQPIVSQSKYKNKTFSTEENDDHTTSPVFQGCDSQSEVELNQGKYTTEELSQSVEQNENILQTEIKTAEEQVDGTLCDLSSSGIKGVELRSCDIDEENVAVDIKVQGNNVSCDMITAKVTTVLESRDSRDKLVREATKKDCDEQSVIGEKRKRTLSDQHVADDYLPLKKIKSSSKMLEVSLRQEITSEKIYEKPERDLNMKGLNSSSLVSDMKNRGAQRTLIPSENSTSVDEITKSPKNEPRPVEKVLVKEKRSVEENQTSSSSLLQPKLLKRGKRKLRCDDVKSDDNEKAKRVDSNQISNLETGKDETSEPPSMSQLPSHSVIENIILKTAEHVPELPIRNKRRSGATKSVNKPELNNLDAGNNDFVDEMETTDDPVESSGDRNTEVKIKKSFANSDRDVASNKNGGNNCDQGHDPTNTHKRSPVHNPKEKERRLEVEETTDNKVTGEHENPSEDINSNKRESINKLSLQKRNRGRPRTRIYSDSEDEDLGETSQNQTIKKGKVTCAKCNAKINKSQWDKHNAKNHAGISWIVGEPAINLNTIDPKELLLKIRTAWKVCQKIKCEQCGVWKKSFLGYHSHLINDCGKSEKEQLKSMVQCKVCGRYLKPYSMPTHEKMHQDAMDVEEAAAVPNKEEEDFVSGGKRKSAIKAMSNLKAVIESNNLHNTCVLYKKGENYPTIDCFFKGRIQSTKRCLRKNCRQAVIYGERFAHFFACPTLPTQFYQCTDCVFYTEDESSAPHICGKSVEDEQYKDEVLEEDEANSEDEKLEFADDDEILSDKEESEKSGEDDELSNELTERKSSEGKTLCATRSLNCRDLQKSFLAAAGINKTNTFNMDLATFKLELTAQKSQLIEDYSILSNSFDMWVELEEAEAAKYFPPLRKSLQFCYEDDIFQMETFQHYNKHGFSGIFVGGPVQAMSWCRVSPDRAATANQYLALSVANDVEKYPSLLTKKTESLIQIWNYGCLSVLDGNTKGPYLEIGLALDHGYLWDMTWSPFDSFREDSKRIGLIAAAFQDGFVRIFSIVEPKIEKDVSKSTPIYKVPEVARLQPSPISTIDNEDPCLNISWGHGGLICGGYRSGKVVIWQISGLLHGFYPKEDDTYLVTPLKVFPAHAGIVTDVEICPYSDRLLITNGSDRCAKFWDMKGPPLPLRSRMAAPRHGFKWIHRLAGVFILENEDVLILDLPSHIRNSNKTYNYRMNSIKDFDINNWAHTLAIVTNFGEVYLNALSDPIRDEPKKKAGQKNDLQMVCQAEVSKISAPKNKKNLFATYADLAASDCLINFKDNKHSKKGYISSNSAKPDAYLASYAATAVEKTAFNPNHLSCNNLVAAFRCGVVRRFNISFIEKDTKVFNKKCQL